MTKQNDMPDEIYVFSDPQSIGDRGFTVIKAEDGFTRYVRADKPADNGGDVDVEALKQDVFDVNAFCGIDSSVTDSDIQRIISDTLNYVSERNLLKSEGVCVPSSKAENTDREI